MSKAPLPSVVVWSVVSLLVMVMVVPALAVSGVGENAKFLMSNDPDDAGAAGVDVAGAVVAVVAVVCLVELPQAANPAEITTAAAQGRIERKDDRMTLVR